MTMEPDLLKAVTQSLEDHLAWKLQSAMSNC